MATVTRAPSRAKRTAVPSRKSAATKAQPKSAKPSRKTALDPAAEGVTPRYLIAALAFTLSKFAKAKCLPPTPGVILTAFRALRSLLAMLEQPHSAASETMSRNLYALLAPPEGRIAVVAHAPDSATWKPLPAPAPVSASPFGLEWGVDMTDRSKVSTINLLTVALGSYEQDPVESMLLGVANDLNLLGVALEATTVTPNPEAVRSAIYAAEVRLEVAAELHGRQLRGVVS